MIRTEQVQDYSQVDKLLRNAFNGDEEVHIVERIRAQGDYEPNLSLVADNDGAITGHIMFSYAQLIDGQKSYKVAGLAPLAVDPSYQRKGIGSALIHEGLERCRQFDIPLVFLIGHPEYYSRFDFVKAVDYGFELKQFEVPDEVFMVYEVQAGALNRYKGELRYSKAFFNQE
ncbi:GNAT family N-acetyltransferase [Paenibacillus sp. GCM10028914]|uniref:GNAT family N-acetyltransferase n=1 Tax=Paenibacillus sp. GCM10028914 TaxID=3273416 RepID=UPI00360793C3